MVHIYFCIDKNIALGNVLMMHWLTKILHWSVSFLAFDYSTAAKYLENYASRTGKSFSEALILASVNPQYDKRLFIEFKEKYKVTTCCVQILF